MILNVISLYDDIFMSWFGKKKHKTVYDLFILILFVLNSNQTC